ncbi:Flp pilus assembly protein CpaB [Cognatishimia maritima]|uniref:Pilus assembly protein CpaB n=1 Tax=Cognatishimia maritima TaxID=870908 RepID=A0A1M5KUJ2_9RHOB|nr:Flp pilus assembly protein CpaB [Cognatishimia maritima]SHG56437.1 pilus assembly protein CpaB [Cognatishimia maritima]
MRGIFAVVLLVGVGLAGIAVHMAQNYVQKYQSALAQEREARTPPIELVEIYAATAQMGYGDPLDPEMVKLVKWPKESLPNGYYMDESVLFPDHANRPRSVIRPLEIGEPILQVKITKPGEDAGLTSQLERGTRAFAIRVDVASGVSGFLRPGDRVDVYWTGSIKGGGSESSRDFTKLIQPGVRLIAIDQQAQVEGVSGNVARTVTVAVKPEQVAALAQAQNSGRLSLALVGAKDDTVAEAIEVDQIKLLGIEREEKKVAVVKEEKKVCTIRTRRGAEVVAIPIPCSN